MSRLFYDEKTRIPLQKLPSYAEVISDRSLIFDLIDERNLIYEDDGLASTSTSLADSILDGHEVDERFVW